MAGIVNTILNILIAAIVARAILSFIVPMAGSSPHPILLSVSNVVNQLTEPILGPLRRALPTLGVLDFSPMVAIIILVVIKEVINRA